MSSEIDNLILQINQAQQIVLMLMAVTIKHFKEISDYCILTNELKLYRVGNCDSVTSSEVCFESNSVYPSDDGIYYNALCKPYCAHCATNENVLKVKLERGNVFDYYKHTFVCVRICKSLEDVRIEVTTAMGNKRVNEMSCASANILFKRRKNYCGKWFLVEPIDHPCFHTVCIDYDWDYLEKLFKKSILNFMEKKLELNVTVTGENENSQKVEKTEKITLTKIEIDE